MWDRAREREKKHHLVISKGKKKTLPLVLYKLFDLLRSSLQKLFSFCLQVETLTCQHISHDGIPEKRDVVDDVPEALEVGEDVVDSVGGRLQGDFEPGEELSYKKKRKKKRK